MAVTNSKVTIFFSASGGTAPTGWTETFYSPQTDLEVSVDQAVKQYVPKRRAILGIGARILAVRASAVPPNRLSFIKFIVEDNGIGNVYTAAKVDDYDPTQVDLLCRIQSSNGHRRQFWVGGLPDSQTDQLLEQGITAPFINGAPFKQLVAAIIASNFQMQVKTANGPPPVFAYYNITSVLPIMVRNRKRGRPFFLFRGRRLV